MNAKIFSSIGFFIITSVTASPPSDLTRDGREAYLDLMVAPQFCDSAVGAGASTPGVVRSFRTLLAEKEADAAFKSLLREARLPGQLYALCGLWFTDNNEFKKAVERYRRVDNTVETMMGCIVSRDHVRELVCCNEPGAVRLSSRDQTIQQWIDINRPASVRYDIIGGAWPQVFKGDVTLDEHSKIEPPSNPSK